MLGTVKYYSALILCRFMQATFVAFLLYPVIWIVADLFGVKLPTRQEVGEDVEKFIGVFQK